MKGKHTGVLHTGLALLIAACMTMASLPTAFAAGTPSAVQGLIERIAALPQPESLTLNVETQYETEAIRWAYDTLNPATLKDQLPETYLQKLESVEEQFSRLIDGLELPEVTEDTTLNSAQFLGNPGLMGIYDGKSAATGSDLVQRWSFNISKGTSDWAATPGTPIVAGDYTYCYVGEQLRKFRTADGLLVAKADAPGEAMFFINLAYGDGKIFVPRYIKNPDNNRTQACVIAYDANSLEQLFMTEFFPSGSQTESQTFYHDGYLYLASWGSNAVFFCFPTADKNPASSSEQVAPVWSYTAGANDSFSANTGPAFVGTHIYFATGGNEKTGASSTIVVADAKTGSVVQKFQLPGQEHVSSTLVYYEKNNRIYIAATNGDRGTVLRSYTVKTDGSLELDSMRCYISPTASGGTQSTPVIYNDRLYLAGGGRTMGSDEPFRVIDANTMEEIYCIDALKSKGSAALTTAYATAENGQTVYLYLIPYAPDRKTGQGAQNPSDYQSSSLYIIKDSIGQTEPSYEIVKNVGDPEYCTQTVVIDKDGNLIFYNDAKGLYCYGNRQDTTITAADVNSQIARLEAPSVYPYYNKTEITRLRERYDGLPPAEQAGVTPENKAKLSAIEDTLALAGEELTVYISEGIANLPNTIGLSDIGKVEALARLAEKAGLMSNKLAEAEQTIQDLLDQEMVKRAEAEIAKIPAEDQLSTAYSNTLAYISSLYSGLSLHLQAQVENAEKFATAKALVASYQKIIDAFQVTAGTLYTVKLDSNRVQSDATLQTVDSALAAVETALREALEKLPEQDRLLVKEAYNGGRHEFLREKAIQYIMESKLSKGTDEGGDYIPVSVAKTNAVEVKKYADMAISYYAQFSEEGKALWNHDDDIVLAKRLLAEAEAVLNLGQGGAGEDPSETDPNPSGGNDKPVPDGSSNGSKPGGSVSDTGIELPATAMLLLLAAGIVIALFCRKRAFEIEELS